LATTKVRLGKRYIESIEYPASGELRVWDSEIRGLFLRVYPTGKKVYALRYRAGDRQCTLNLGVHGSPQTPEGARAAAMEALSRLARGEDPTSERRARMAAKSVSELIDHYLTDGPATKPDKRQSTWEIDASNLNRHIRPLLGRRLADSITNAEAARAIHAIAEGKTASSQRAKKARGRVNVTGGEGTARRTRTTAAAMFAWGIKHGLVKTNPFSGIPTTSAPVREKFLTPSETAALFAALDDAEREEGASADCCDAVRLLLLTGARKTEIIGLRWSEVERERARLSLPPERTKAGGKTGRRYIALSTMALDILNRRATTDTASAFVFPAKSSSGHLIALRRPFLKICERAKLQNLRIHDLRHTFASAAIASGHSLFAVGKALGHANTRTTERYAHLTNDPLVALANSVEHSISNADRKPQ
jgi:integrase